MDSRTVAKLREMAPWPAQVPYPEARFVERGERQGLEIVLEKIPRDREFWILEIGAEFGGSTRTFLDVAPGVRVISADLWPSNYWLKPAWKDLAEYVRPEGGMLRLFQTYCWEHRERSYPIRGFSTTTLARLHAAGVRPDLVYVDGDHTHDGVFQDLAVAHALFPDAILTGDDWEYRPTHPRYEGMELPVQYGVKRFALHHRYEIVARGTTWVIDTTKKPTFAPPMPRPYEVAARVEKLEARIGERFGALDERLARIESMLAHAADASGNGSAAGRKLRKLVRDPVKFVEDSQLARMFRR